MASTIHFELVTPERLMVSEVVDEVTAPGFLGEFGVLPEHTYFLTILSIGVMSYRVGGETFKIALGGGFAEVTPEKVVIMADVAERAEEIDRERARQAFERAETAVKELSLDDHTYQKAYAALQRAMVRMAAAD